MHSRKCGGEGREYFEALQKERKAILPRLPSPHPPTPFCSPAGVNLRVGGLGPWAKRMLILGHLPPHFSPAASLERVHVTSQADRFLRWKCSFYAFLATLGLQFLSCYSLWLIYVPCFPVTVTFPSVILHCQMMKSEKVGLLLTSGWRYRLQSPL